MDQATVFPYDEVEAAISTLKSEVPEANESSIFSGALESLEPISSKHDNYLGDFLSQIGNGGSINADYLASNEAYSNLIDNVSAAVSKMRGADSNGGVESPGTGQAGTGSGDVPSYQPTGNGNGNVQSRIDSGTGEQPQTWSGEQTETPAVEGEVTSAIVAEQTPENTVPAGKGDTTPTGELPGATGTTDIPSGETPSAGVSETTAGAVVGAGAGVATAATGVVEEVGGLGSSEESVFGKNNPMGNYTLDPKTWESLPQEVKDDIIDRLRKLGYSDEQINAIISGKEPVPKVAVDAISNSLSEAIAAHPELKDLIIDQYGFDIFNPDGSVNKDKLSLALLMDAAKGDDGLDIVSLLHDKYGIDVVNNEALVNLTSKLTEALAKNGDIRGFIIDKYGFDIFNPDGSINKTKLAIAMLMDKQSNTDGFDLNQIILDMAGNGYSLEDIASNIVRPSSNANVKSGSFATLPLAAALGVGVSASTMAGGIKAVKKGQKEKSKEEKDDEVIKDAEFVDEKDKKKKKEKDKSWLWALGLGLGAAAATKKVKDEMEEAKEEEKTKMPTESDKNGDDDSDQLVMI